MRNKGEMSDYIWETFDGLFKTVYAHGRRVEALEARIADLEQRLNERHAAAQQQQKPQTQQQISAVSEMPAERAA
jgi:BMFP domain-containing protein YqiC